MPDIWIVRSSELMIGDVTALSTTVISAPFGTYILPESELQAFVDEAVRAGLEVDRGVVVL